LLKHDADIEAQDIDNNTSLHLAAHLGKLAVVKVLLLRGAISHGWNKLD
jgi:ankyrin repeat protein